MVRVIRGSKELFRLKSLTENSEWCCFREKGWMARRDEGEYPLWGFVVANVTARSEDAPFVPPRPNPKSPAAAPLTIFSQALTNNASALVSRSPVRLTWSETGAGVGLESLCEFHNRFSLASILRDGEDNLRHK